MRNFMDKLRMQYSPMKALAVGVSVAILIGVIVFIVSQVSKMEPTPTATSSAVEMSVDEING